MIKIPSITLFIVLIGLVSILTRLGIVLEINILKYISVILQIYILIISFMIIKSYKRFIIFHKAIPLLLIITVLPFFRILFVGVGSFDIKMITDGFFVQGSYYQLPIIGLALAILSIKNHNLKKSLYQYAVLTLPIGILLMIYSIKYEALEGGVGVGYLAYTNVFIPAALLAFFSKPKYYMYLGWASIMLLLFFSAMQATRSYTLVGVYLAIGALAGLYTTNKKAVFSIIIIGMASYFSGLFSFFSQSTEVYSASLYEKFQFDTLVPLFVNFLRSGDFLTLFLWEGNSRADILFDAFGNFSSYDWMFGRGMFATYHSFVERSTIEMGWAQETFRWGIIYTIFVIGVLLRSRRFIKKFYIKYNVFYSALGTLILVKVLDGFVYGMPEYTVYNLFIYWGVMLTTIKKNIFLGQRYV